MRAKTSGGYGRLATCQDDATAAALRGLLAEEEAIQLAWRIIFQSLLMPCNLCGRLAR